SASSPGLSIQLLPKQFKQGPGIEQAGSLQSGEKPVINLMITSSKKRTELIPAPKWEIEGKLKNQIVQNKPRPRPGDLIEIFRIGYEHWAIYVEDDCVVHLAPPSEDFEVGSITSIFSNRAVVKYSRLEDVLHGCSWKINNKLDGTYLPLPVEKIIQRTKIMINKTVQYSLIEGNCEHFVNDLRYARTSSTILNKYGESGQPCLVPDRSGITLSFSPFNLMLAVNLLVTGGIENGSQKTYQLI
ncbi:hypothetical protein STEG23_000631, partial [Scotinomys teguina]